MEATYKSFAQLKREALDQLSGKWGNAIGLGVIYFVLAIAVNMILESITKNLSSLTGFILGPILIVTYTYYLDYAKGIKPRLVEIADRVQKYLMGAVLVFVMGILIFLWTLLLIIPGIIKSISYSMTYYIFAENPDINILDAITLSRKMMDGHKMRYFILNMSFIGWAILAILTFGIGLLWLSPYIKMTMTNFYLDLKEQYEAKNRVESNETVKLEEPVKEEMVNPVETVVIEENDIKEEPVEEKDAENSDETVEIKEDAEKKDDATEI